MSFEKSDPLQKLLAPVEEVTNVPSGITVENYRRKNTVSLKAEPSGRALQSQANRLMGSTFNESHHLSQYLLPPAVGTQSPQQR
jgi:hypothetical protein